MAECNVSIDKNKLPGVKEVCRDFAVLEDHCLAYNLQEQEIESHLASNVHKSRLVQKDLQVAKKLQEEEDERAKIQSQKQHSDIERQDNEIAQEIQEELVRQAEQQRQQEEKDAAIARKLHEKEMKEERRRQKQMETNFDEDYFEDHGAARRPLDLDQQSRHKLSSAHAPVGPHTDYNPDHGSTEPRKSRHPKLDSASPHSRSRYPEHYLVAEGGHGRHADPYPEHLLPSRGKHRDGYPDYESAQTGRARRPSWEDAERVVRQKERPARSPTAQTERDEVWDRQHDRGRDYEWERHMERDKRDRERDYDWERHGGRDRKRDREQDRWARDRDRERSRDRVQSVDGRETDRLRQRDKDRHRARTRSGDRGLADDHRDLVPGRERPKKTRASLEEEEDDERGRKARGRRVHSSPEEVFDEFLNDGGRGEPYDPRQGYSPSRERNHSHPSGETGRIVHRGSGAVVAETEYGLNEATKGMTKLDLQEQEIIDLEMARKLHEEELKSTSMQVRAAQVAQDEEIARLLMEQDKKEYKKNREREKEKERERERLAMERMAMERRRPEGDYRPHSEDVVRPRTRNEHEYQRQKNHSKPARSPQPRQHNYENVSPAYGHSDHQVAPRAPARPEAALKGAYYKR
ncbi:coiled-coil domain-containing protein 50 isoform X1 [Salarias fasciatus]|uniref:Coiled-coil domain-containing protein n=1 Tax=Salarias fasciatus TaxID=181472 RepID=A0A672JSA5_SALFA|nr:coiled-coil domain-containing protein 50 isoform X1 [Salarias fasciatus]